MMGKLRCEDGAFVECVVFDLDGTLVDAYRTIRRAFNATMDELGHPPQSLEDIIKWVGYGPQKLLSHIVPETKIEEALRIYKGYYREFFLDGDTHLIDGAEEILNFLKDNDVALGVASNKPAEFTKPLIEHLGIGKYFDRVICGDEVGELKPSPKALLEIISSVGAKADSTVYVGDMDVDVQTGKNAGCRTVAVLTGSSLYEELARLSPWKILGSVKELKEIFIEDA